MSSEYRGEKEFANEKTEKEHINYISVRVQIKVTAN